MNREDTFGRSPQRRSFGIALALTASLLAAFAVAACGGNGGGNGGVVGQTVPVDGGSFTRITPLELQDMLRTKDFKLINVHVPYEGEIEGTDLFIPYNQIANAGGALPGKDAKIVLYCRSGNMSTQAAEALVRAGYTNVYELGGGMIAWADSGLPVITKN